MPLIGIEPVTLGSDRHSTSEPNWPVLKIICFLGYKVILNKHGVYSHPKIFLVFNLTCTVCPRFINAVLFILIFTWRERILNPFHLWFVSFDFRVLRKQRER